MLENIRSLIFLQSNLARLFLADFLVRSFYQVGKTPLLPLFAASIGAGEVIIGFIVSVSTMTGMLLKPLFGILSDRWGRKIWLLVATLIFSGIPFLYEFITTDQELILVRLFHGISTAIFGPVSLAYVASLDSNNVGSRIAFFGISRLLASLIAPLIAGILLTFLDFEVVFMLIGFCSLVAMAPIFLLSDNHIENPREKVSITKYFYTSFASSIKIASIWLAGLLELMVYLTIYAVKAFLPIFIISQEGGTIFQAGLFFFTQEFIHIIFRVVGGKLADRNHTLLAIVIGMFLIALGLSLLNILPQNLLLLSAGLFGAGQGFIFPSSVAMLSRKANKIHIGAAMGLYGALRNLGKVIGPIIAGLLLSIYSYAIAFYIFALMIVLILVPIFIIWIKER